MAKTAIEVIETSDELTHVRLSGRLDIAGVDQIETTFTATVCPKNKPTLVDVSGITFMASMGIRMLVSAARQLTRRGAKIVLYGAPAIVRESIERTALDDLLPMVKDEQAARAELGL